MVEIRHRLALPDSDLLGYGYRQPRFAPDQGRSFSAIDLACPTCRAEPGYACVTGRMSSGRHPVPLLCPDRIELARQAVAEGMLDSQGPAAPVRPQACRSCQAVRHNGRPLACAPEHRCSRLTGEQRCRFAVVSGSDLCTMHKEAWANHSVSRADAPETPKRRPGPAKGSPAVGGRPKVTAEDRIEIVQGFKDGITVAELARRYNVSSAAIRYHLIQAGVLKR